MNSIGVRNFYDNKSILITGATEFIGKVILEKILRTMPNIGKIYLLIRNKEGTSYNERFRREVASCPCFEKLRKSIKKFEEFLESKVVVFPGSIMKEGLDLTEDVSNMLIEKVNIIMHCASTADFNARLDDAIKINVKGPMEVLNLAKRMKNLENFVYVSTCYVNSDKIGIIEERIYNTEQDPDILLKEIGNIPPTQIVHQTPAVLGTFPNTWSFTFALCERLLDKHRESVPLTVVRLSIVGATWRDPFPGWVEKVSTAGALYLLGGIGVIKVAKGDPKLIGDQIPVDFGANAVIVAGAKYAKSPNPIVVHCGTSAQNPITWGECTNVVASYWNAHPPQKRVADCSFRLQKNPNLLKAEQFARRAPTVIYSKFAQLIDHPGLKRSAGKAYNSQLRSEQLSEQFQHFTMNEWIFVAHRLGEMNQFCSEEEKEIFPVDVKKIEWRRYLLNYAWGLQKFILKENIDLPTQIGKVDALQTSGKFASMSTALWPFTRGISYTPKSAEELKKIVLSSKKLNDVIRDMVINKKSMNLSDQQFEEYLYKVAAKECTFIFSTLEKKMLAFVAYLCQLVNKQIYEKILLDESALETLKQLDNKAAGPVIFLPTHRSYMDFMLLSYSLFAFSIKCPHIVSAEDFLSMALVPHLLRGGGAFYIRRKKAEVPEVYNAVLYEYIQALLVENSWLEFFVEGTRSRYGKTLAPKNGILNIVLDAIYQNKIPDAQIVPLTINYDRILEAETYPYELLGEQKVKESLTRMIKASSVLNMNFGRVYLDFLPHFSAKKYIENAIETKKIDPYNNRADRSNITRSLSQEVVYQLNEGLVVMPTAMVASLLLVHRKGISEENLHNEVEWLVEQLQMRNVKVGLSEGRPTVLTTKSAISLIDSLVNLKKDMYHIHLAAKEDHKNILLLSIYRNTLIHAFWNESIVACALSSFGQEVAWKEGVNIERLWKEVEFLNMLVSREFQMREKVTRDSLASIIMRMTKFGVLEVTEGDEKRIKVARNGNEIMSYLCHLIWPFVESYWATMVYLFSIRNRATPILMQKFLQEIQWFIESIFDERIIEFYEACALDTIRNAFAIYKQFKVVEVTKKNIDKTMVSEEVVELAMPEEKVKAMEDHIKRFLKDSFAKSVNSPIELARKSVLLDFPFMSKL